MVLYTCTMLSRLLNLECSQYFQALTNRSMPPMSELKAMNHCHQQSITQQHSTSAQTQSTTLQHIFLFLQILNRVQLRLPAGKLALPAAFEHQRFCNTKTPESHGAGAGGLAVALDAIATEHAIVVSPLVKRSRRRNNFKTTRFPHLEFSDPVPQKNVRNLVLQTSTSPPHALWSSDSVMRNATSAMGPNGLWMLFNLHAVTTPLP